MTDMLTTNNLGYYLTEWAERSPSRTAVIDLFGGKERIIDYGTLDDRMTMFANVLLSLGMEPGERLIMSVSNRIEFMEIMFGAMRAGIVPVPINTGLSADVIDYIIGDSDCRGGLVEPIANTVIADIVDQHQLGVKLILDGVRDEWNDYETAMAGVEPTLAPTRLSDDHICFQAYTSGSTGRPKGVPLTHAGQVWWLDCYARYWPPNPDARSLVAVPLYHKNAMAGAAKPRLVAGGSFVLMPQFNAQKFLQNIENYKVTTIGGVPTVFSLILQEQEMLQNLDLSSLQLAIVGSAPVHDELFEEMRDKLGCEVMQSYGLTEGGPVMFGPPVEGGTTPIGSAGKPWPEGEVKLVDTEGDDSVNIGELWVRNPGVISGYHNLPKINAERIVDGWLRTGDLFRRDEDDFYYFVGRTDDMFNCGGENIYPQEVENLLMSHPAVNEACVVPVPYRTKGDAPVTMLSLIKGADADEEEIKSYCLKNGPAYAHPRRIIIVDELPLSGARKIDRSWIKKRMTDECQDLA
jgi:long-chain acyl-CoA synthetase